MTELERLDLFRRRGYLCEICHENQATDLHHCLFRRDKHKPQLNHEFNCECLCRYCHMMGYGDTFDHRCAFYVRQVERYGLSFEMWLEDEIKPLYKIKRFEFIGERKTPLGSDKAFSNLAVSLTRGTAGQTAALKSNTVYRIKTDVRC